MTHIVEITESAEQEFEDQYDYIARRSAQGANSWAMAFRAALKKLETSPTCRPLAPESESHTEDIYQLLFKTRGGNSYRALFVIRRDRVYVIHIRGEGQDIMAPGEVRMPEAE